MENIPNGSNSYYFVVDQEGLVSSTAEKQKKSKLVTVFRAFCKRIDRDNDLRNNRKELTQLKEKCRAAYDSAAAKGHRFSKIPALIFLRVLEHKIDKHLKKSAATSDTTKASVNAQSPYNAMREEFSNLVETDTNTRTEADTETGEATHIPERTQPPAVSTTISQQPGSSSTAAGRLALLQQEPSPQTRNLFQLLRAYEDADTDKKKEIRDEYKSRAASVKKERYKDIETVRQDIMATGTDDTSNNTLIEMLVELHPIDYNQFPSVKFNDSMKWPPDL